VQGQAGYAISRLLRCIGYSPDVCRRVHNLVVCDTQGIIHRGRKGLYNNKYKFILADETNPEERSGSVADAVAGADIFIGVSGPGVLTGEMIKTMNDDPIIFAMANPVPEIYPDEAREAGAGVVCTGRSDYPNQVNNALAFPGVFRGALDACATKITDEMKIAAAHALAGYIKKPNREHILPSVLDKGVTRAIADAVRDAAIAGGCARKV
jgi:Malic enzyme